MAKIVSLRHFFRQKEKTASYKRAHFLNQLPAHKLEEILLFSEGDHIGPLLPSFEGKRVLFLNDQKHKYVFKKVLAAEPAYLVNYVYRGDVAETRPEYHTVIGDIENLALRRNHFDVVICPFALAENEFVENFIANAGRYFDNGSRLVLSVRHPQLENVLTNQNPAETRTGESSVSRYYRLLKENHLYAEELREGAVDLALKAFFSDGEVDYYHDYKNTPVTLLFRTVKFLRKTAG